MATSKLYMRIALIAVGFCCALSINENEFLMKRSKVKSSGVLKDEKFSKRDSKTDPISEESPTDNNDLRLSRRQTTCCSVTPSSCNANSPYRTMDGTCNNLANPCWGSAGNPFARLLTPQYANGISTPRGSSNNPPLPRPRTISSGLAGTVNTTSEPSDDITLMVMQWGQFCDHDMTFAPEDNVTNCCNGSTHASCLPINVTGDAFYQDFNVTCLPFVRSTATNCSTGSTREQMNARTAFLDASQVYGSSDQELNTLRVPNSYLLKFDPGENTNCAVNNPSLTCRTFLPTRPNNMTGNTEFFAGDARLEQQPGLTSMHTIFVRLHNDFSEILRNRNPYCTNDKIFQETRKIIGALMQQITYNEFLPATIGRTVMEKWGLLLGGFPGYNSSLNPSTFNVFATASFRFGHSLIRNIFTLPSTSVNLAESFNNHARTTLPFTLPSHFMRGLAFDASEPMDHIIADAVRNKLFARQPFTNGEDLFSRNIQRGRDHGIGTYRNWINNYFPGKVNTFSDLDNLMPTQVVATLNNLYGGRLDDLDLFPVAIAEHKLNGSLLGPTFAHINGEYFSRLKYGDRFWYENGIFSYGQLSAIYETKLSHIICLCTNAPSIQEWVMQLANSYNNQIIDCNILIHQGVVDSDALWNHWGNLCTSPG